MTTPNNPDPFSSPDPAAAQQPQQPPAPAPSEQPAYGTPAAYAQAGYAPIAIPSTTKGPSKVAGWAIGLTGAYTLLALLAAIMAPGMVDTLKETLANPEDASPFATTDPISFLTFPVSIASYVLLALWMWRLRQSQKDRGADPGGVPAVEWWGWFVPLGNLVLPFLGMRSVTRKSTPFGLLWGWWIPFVVGYSVSTFASIGATFGAIDWETGEYTNLESLDSIVGASWVSAIAILISWAFLVMIIRKATASEQRA